MLKLERFIICMRRKSFHCVVCTATMIFIEIFGLNDWALNNWLDFMSRKYFFITRLFFLKALFKELKKIPLPSTNDRASFSTQSRHYFLFRELSSIDKWPDSAISMFLMLHGVLIWKCKRSSQKINFSD